jgi:hypothetical protein
VRGGVDQDAVLRRRCLEASGRVDDVAGGQAPTFFRPCRHGDERLAGRDPDPYLDVRLLPCPVTDRDRRPDGALGVVLVRARRAEDRHDCVADELFHGATVPLELVP